MVAIASVFLDPIVVFGLSIIPDALLFLLPIRKIFFECFTGGLTLKKYYWQRFFGLTEAASSL